MNILVIGGNGFLGRELYRYLKMQRFNVFCTSHSDVKDKNFFKLDINTPLSEDILKMDFDAVVYLVHIYDIEKSEILINWYKKTFMLLSKKTKKQIYISSYSANSNAISHYGSTKYDIENFFIENHAYCISPGLIIGDGGIYQKIKNIVLKIPILAIPSNKTSNLLPVIDVKDVCKFTAKLITTSMNSRNYNIYNEMTTLLDLVRNIAYQNNKKIILFKISANFVLKVMRIVESIGINLPVNSDSLQGFIANQKYVVNSDL